MSTEYSEPQIDQVTLPGEILKSAREAKGLTVEEMSAISNLTKQVIRGIEANEYDDLAGLSFVRGYLKLYAKKLGVDETTVLEPFDAWKRVEYGDPGADQNRHGVDSITQADMQTGAPAAGWYAFGGVVLASLLVAGVVISLQDSAETEPEVAPAVEMPDDSTASEVAESSDIIAQPQTNQSDRVQLSDAARPIDERDVTDDSETEPSGPVVETAERVETNDAEESVADAPVSADRSAPAEPPIESAAVEPDVTEPDVTAPESTVAEDTEPVATTESETARRDAEPTATETESAVVEESAVVSSESEPESASTESASVAEAASSDAQPEPPAEAAEEPPTRTTVSEGRVVAEAANLEAPSPEPEPPEDTDRSDDDGLRVLSETVTGPDADDQAMGARGLLEMRFTGESWVEVRDARGRLVVADLMEAGRFVSLQTFGPIEVLVGAVNDSTVIFNGETLDLSDRSYQNVARVTLGAETN